MAELPKSAETPSSFPREDGTSHPRPTSAQHRQTVVPMFVSARQSIYGPCPVEMDCPHCQAHIVSHIERIAGSLPWILCGVLVLLGFFLFLVPWLFCCLPFCVDQCLDVVHSCPACKRNLGRFKRV
ncbi:unnamed protein product [Cylicocyclus nassatus]|uniref:LITAF domain-containing protein n=1 Tax=Cylicocyclus nassatus TaxID=53992 RepID=A0AA36GLK2_CYLNA|nr:unnamed protein product [Cylicocyclus nassatus]